MMKRYPITISGLVIALIGFGLTRFTVTLAAMDSTGQYVFAGAVPLIMGLSLTAFGVVLAVGAYDATLVKTTARWCVLGTITMALLALITALGTEREMLTNPDALRRQAYLSNFLIGGAVGGTLTGLYAARTYDQQTTLGQQTNRLILLNRLLRDQIINSAMAIKGHAGVLEQERNEESVGVVDRQADNIVDIVENVKYLAETADRDEVSLGAVALNATVQRTFDQIRDEYPAASYSLDLPAQDVSVRANTQLEEVMTHLFENAIEYSEKDRPELGVTVETSSNYATVTIADNGPGLPEGQQTLLEDGEIAEFDDPTTGFGLNIVRLLVEGFDGDIETTVTEQGTSIEVRLLRTDSDGNGTEGIGSTTGVTFSRVPREHTALAVPIGLVSGLAMAISMAVTGFELEAISALYGIEDLAFAVITHEFHSIVFALIYAAVLVVVPQQYAQGLGSHIGVGIVMGLALWLFAAGLVMPVWLQLVGIEAPLPNVTVPSLVGHVVWGSTTGLLYHVGNKWVAK